jgi:cystathionine beta-lyase/cystathionine gamma-synthase
MIPIYSLNRQESRNELSLKIANRYDAPNCHLFSSGTQAIYMILDSLASFFQTGLFLISKDIYRGTQKLIIPELQHRYPKIEFRIIDLFESDPSSILSECQVLFLESCSNPCGYIWNPSNYSKINPEAYLVVDNTWLSPTVFNPFEYEGGKFKIVIDSCVKYISGGTCMMGSACFQEGDPIIKRVASQIKITGIQVATSSCQLVSKMIDSLDDRIQHSYHRTQLALQAFSQSSQVDMIKYPTNLDNFIYGPSVVCIHITTSIVDKSEIEAITVKSGFKWMTSFAHPEDSIEPSLIQDSAGIWLRISFGYLEATNVSLKIHQFLKYFFQ